MEENNIVQDVSNEALKYKVDLLTAEAASLRENEHIYRTALSLSEDVFVYQNMEKKKTFISEKFCSMFAISEKTPLNLASFLNAVSDQNKKLLYDITQEEQDKRLSYTLEILLADERTWILASVHMHCNEEGRPVERVIFFRDITALKNKKDELEYMAYFDSLTGLYNRNYFIKRLQESIEKAKAGQDIISVLYLDIDDFKTVNDTLGILSGDEVVQRFARDIEQLLGDSMFAARLSNDEFCVAIINPEGSRTAEGLYEKLSDIVMKGYRLADEREVKLTVSAGTAEYPESGGHALELLKNAEIAVFEVKKHGKNNICYFDDSMYSEFLENIKLERQLGEAVDNEDFLLHYQPQYDIKTGRLRGVEALVRWQKQDGSMVAPDCFIPISEKNGSIINIGDWVMDKAVETLAYWRKEFGFKGIMSINISTVQIRKEDFVRKLKEIIDKHYVEPEQIEIEITESVLIDDLNGILEKLHKLKAYGIKISLDDFGTGYSSLAYLKSLPIDTLKIDKSFIDSVLEDRSTNIITQSVISMVKKLGVVTVAEGVESKEQLEYLKKMNCDTIQGYLLGRPMDQERIEEVILKEEDRQ